MPLQTKPQMSPALAGIRVLDLSRLLPGPFCSMLLADFGADVIKIEDPNGGDYIRWWPPLVGGNSGFHVVLNRNKRSLTLNLKSEEGKEKAAFEDQTDSGKQPQERQNSRSHAAVCGPLEDIKADPEIPYLVARAEPCGDRRETAEHGNEESRFSDPGRFVIFFHLSSNLTVQCAEPIEDEYDEKGP